MTDDSNHHMATQLSSHPLSAASAIQSSAVTEPISVSPAMGMPVMYVGSFKNPNVVSFEDSTSFFVFFCLEDE